MVDAVTSTQGQNSVVQLLQENRKATEAVNSANKQQSGDFTGIADNFNSFLQLFLTQLKNQDPTSPQDASQLTAQLAQFAGVEQQLKSNDKLDQLVSQNQAFEISSASSYVGSEVRVLSNKLEFYDNPVTIGYTIPEDAERATVVIKDSSGVIINQISVDSKSGEKTYTWDGGDQAGNKVNPGVYDVSIYTGTADRNLESAIKPKVSTIVSGVDLDQENKTTSLLLTNGDKVKSSDILFVGGKL